MDMSKHVNHERETLMDHFHRNRLAGQHGSAVACLERALQTPEYRPEALIWKGIEALQQQQPHHAFIYLACAALLTPWAHPWQALQLSPLQGWLLLACCLNTLVAYGAFAEALAHWEASRVSAALAVTPLVTFAAVAAAAALWPERVAAEDANLLAYLGALLVVLGSAATALAPSLVRSYRGRRQRRQALSAT